MAWSERGLDPEEYEQILPLRWPPSSQARFRRDLERRRDRSRRAARAFLGHRGARGLSEPGSRAVAVAVETVLHDRVRYIGLDVDPRRSDELVRISGYTNRPRKVCVEKHVQRVRG